MNTPAAPHTAINETMADTTACGIGLSMFMEAMQDRLKTAAREGRGGWHIVDQCSVDHLAQLLLVNLSRGNLVSVGNYAMMLYMREGGDAALVRAWLKLAGQAQPSRSSQG